MSVYAVTQTTWMEDAVRFFHQDCLINWT